MSFKVGQKVAYPNHGVCFIESIDSKKINGGLMDFYSMRLLSNNSLILVPKDNTESIGIRPIINRGECDKVLSFLEEDFGELEGDWKIRIRDFGTKVQTGDIYEVAEVLKKLTCLTHLKALSFREQRLFEKTKFLIVSELATVCSKSEEEITENVDKLLTKCFEKYTLNQIPVISYAAN